MQLSRPFKARCSAIGKIMSEPQTKHPKQVYLDHIDRIVDLENKIDSAKNKETATYKKQCDTLDELRGKTDLLKLNSERIHLSKTCIEYVYEYLKEQPEFYGRSVHFKSKYCDKGNEMEAESIKLAAQHYGWGNVEKNTTRKSNHYLIGEPDIVLPESIEDIKNSWSQKTFPLFGTEIPIDGYGWQGQGYLELYDRPRFGLVYTLMDAPLHMIEREAWGKARELGYDELEAELYDEVLEMMTYSNFPIELRIKRYQLDRDRNCMGNVERRVEDINKFIELL